MVSALSASATSLAIIPFDTVNEELRNIQEDPAYADLARWVIRPLLKQEKLFGKYDMVVVEGDFRGPMPLHWITRSDFERAIHVLSQIERGEGRLVLNLEHMSTPTWKDQVIDSFQKLMTRTTSRSCIFECIDYLESNNKKIKLGEHNFSCIVDDLTCDFMLGVDFGYYVAISLKEVSVEVGILSEDHRIIPGALPLFLTVLHELIHIKHRMEGTILFDAKRSNIVTMLASSSEMRYDGGIYIWPQIDVRYDNWEEMWTIAGLPGYNETVNRFTENNARKEFGLPPRIFHCAYADIAGREGVISERSDIESLLIAYYRNDVEHIDEILEKGGRLNLIETCFKNITSPINGIQTAFLCRVIRSLSDEGLYEITKRCARYDIYRDCLIRFVMDPSFRKDREGAAVLALIRTLWEEDSSVEWKAAVLETIRAVIEEMKLIPFEDLTKNAFLEKYSLLFALFCGQEERIDALKESVRHVIFYAGLTAFSTEKIRDIDECLLRRITGSCLRSANYAFYVSTYWRDSLLKASMDPAFVAGKEKEILEYWETILTGINISRTARFYDIPSREAESYPHWREEHRGEIQAIIDRLKTPK
ncbi:MAG: hypothetical protein HY860_06510 [Chlamydiales bacterium]|nr:hypothetical protein [Chlamydiales bacterium]